MWFDGCGEMGYSVTTGAMLYYGIHHLDKEWRTEFLAANRPANNRDCFERQLREGRIGSKYWILCEGPTPARGRGGGQYNLNVIIQEKEYLFRFKCEIDSAYFEVFDGSGEVERIVKAVQVWDTDE